MSGSRKGGAVGGAGVCYSTDSDNVADCNRFSKEEVQKIFQDPIGLAAGINFHSKRAPGTHKGTSKASGTYVSAVNIQGHKIPLHLSVHPSGRTDAIHVKNPKTGEEVALMPIYKRSPPYELWYFRRDDVGSKRAGNTAWGFAGASRAALMNTVTKHSPKPKGPTRRETRKLRKRSKSLKNH